jgi:parallel beta-helix repeat protein
LGRGGLLKRASVLAGLTSVLCFIALQGIADARLVIDISVFGNPCSGVRVDKGMRFQALINRRSQGQRFCWEPGKYFVRRALVPKDGQKFVAVQPRETVLVGRGDTPIAFDGLDTSGVVLDGLVIRNFATPVEDGMGAVRAGNGWTIRDSAIKRNGSAGIFHGSNVVISNNLVSHNGQYGITAYRARNALVVGNEVSYNNTLNLSNSDEGGSKWTGTTGLVLRDNNFHDNRGNGIWVDGDNLNVVIEGNRAIANTGKGIHYETSCAGVIRNNTSSHNGESGIEVVASRDVEVSENLVEDNAYGIRLWDQERGGGSNCEWKLRDVTVARNTVLMREGYTGVERCCGVTNDTVFTSGTVRFLENVYYLDLSGENFHWLDDARSVDEWVAFGQDVLGVFNPLP